MEPEAEIIVLGVQSHEGLPLVVGDGSGESTVKIHVFGATWAVLCADGYEVATFANATLKCAPIQEQPGY